MIVVTSGKRYIDIDAYASCVAYRDFLRLQGKDVVAVTGSVINESVAPSLRELSGFDDYAFLGDEEFAVLDLSNPDFLDECVDIERIVELIDHHAGFENYWDDKVRRVRIEKIGAVATIVFERYRDGGALGKLRPELAKLLMAAILDNTLNFKAKITTERDVAAYKELVKIAGEDDEFAEKYFLECQAEVERDLATAIRNDVKSEKVDFALPETIAQLLCWDGKEFLKREDELRNILSGLSENWMMNLISLKDGRSYVLVSDDAVAREVLRLFGGVREGNVVILDEVWLRKEILKRALEDAGK